jgi:hypothetical protein
MIGALKKKLWQDEIEFGLAFDIVHYQWTLLIHLLSWGLS